VTSARTVPVTTDMSGDELDAEDAWHLARRVGLRRLLVDSFVRFRYGDGFSHSRALGLQLCLAIVPFMIALSGLATDLGAEAGGQVVADTVVALTPGASEPLVRDLLNADEGTEDAGEFALVVGLITGLLALAQAMAQIERGANRIYGVERDRPAVPKYLRASVLAVVAGLPALFGFLLLVAGGSFGEAMQESYGWSEGTLRLWNLVRWPAGLALTTLTIAVLLDHAPRRRQPALSWLALGATVAVCLTLLAAGGLAAYVKISGSFGETYGPLAGIVALLLWSLLSAMAFFYGTAVCAQLEALRAGEHEPAYDDPGRPHGRLVRSDRAAPPSSRA